MIRSYYRRVWEYKATGWDVVGEGYIKYDDLLGNPQKKLPCVPTTEYPTAACSPQAGPTPLGHVTPAYYEIWWDWVPSTWGAGNGGSWRRAAGGGNYPVP